MTILEPNFELEKKVKKGLDAIKEGMAILEFTPSEVQATLKVINRYEDIYKAILEVNENYKKLQKTIEISQKTKIENNIKENHKKSGYKQLAVRVSGSFESKK